MKCYLSQSVFPFSEELSYLLGSIIGVDALDSRWIHVELPGLNSLEDVLLDHQDLPPVVLNFEVVSLDLTLQKYKVNKCRC